MNFKALLTIAMMGVASIAHANEILLTSNQPLALTYRVISGKHQQNPVASPLQSIHLNGSKNISVPMQQQNYAGIAIVAINGKTLPAAANNIFKPEQCAVLTNTKHATAALLIKLNSHSVTCSNYGGVFG